MQNREIKFRVWDKQFNQFCPDWFGDSRLSLNQMFDTQDGRFVFQQFTGLKDKNGKEIYEGDVIQYNRRSSYDGTNFKVKWSEDNWGWVLVSRNKDYLTNEWTPEGNRYNFIEVVGNIFENPELLNEKTV